MWGEIMKIIDKIYEQYELEARKYHEGIQNDIEKYLKKEYNLHNKEVIEQFLKDNAYTEISYGYIKLFINGSIALLWKPFKIIC